MSEKQVQICKLAYESGRQRAIVTKSHLFIVCETIFQKPYLLILLHLWNSFHYAAYIIQHFLF